jgi:uncharacterized protein YigE (DUF2233 family)
VKRHLVWLLSLIIIAASALAQSSDTRRKEWEKEKNGPHGECAVQWTTMHAGIEYRTVRCLGDEDDLDLHIVRIDPRKWSFDTLVSGSGTYARNVARDKDAPFAINTNFFDKARDPLGVIVRSGKVVQPPRTTGWQSIFLMTENNRAYVIPPDQWAKYRSNVWMAVQAGPRLVVGGHVVNLKPNYSAPRAGVCIQWDREVMFFATPATRKLHVTEMARVARRPEADGGLACRDAMLFDGGHSVNFFVEGNGEKTISITGDPVPVFIYATPRK